jgi:hypothetical protein
MIGYVLAFLVIVNAIVQDVPNDTKLKAAADASPDDRLRAAPRARQGTEQ